jgi:amino acid transporter
MDKPADESPHLIRALGPFMAMAIVVGIVIGSGIFKKPQQVAQNVANFGPAALVWVLGGVLAFLGALALAEVAVLYPRAGGNYVFLREAYGRPAAFLWGWVEFWLIRAGSIAALATVFAQSLADVLRNPALRAAVGFSPTQEALGFWEQRGLTIGVLVVLTLINIRGVRYGAGLQAVVTTVKVGSLLAICALPFVALALTPAENEAARPNFARLEPLWPGGTVWDFGWGRFGVALVGVLFAYHGWMSVALMAGEVRNPQRNLPLAFLGGTAAVIVLYLGANLAYYLMIPRAEMAALGETTVATAFSARLLGPVGGAFASAAVMMSTFGALNANLLVGPRLLYAMGEDGLAPKALGAVHPRWHTPVVATLVLACWTMILVVSAAVLTHFRPLTFDNGRIDLNVPKGQELFDLLTTLAMFGAVSFETLAVGTIFVFRRRYPEVARPYRCWGYPVAPALYIAIMLAVLFNMFSEQRVESLIGVGFLAVGGVVYYLFLSKRVAPV